MRHPRWLRINPRSCGSSSTCWSKQADLIAMAGNTFGRIFTVTSFGESHGPAIDCVVDGCPPGMNLSVDDIQKDLDRRKPGTSRHVTQRQETDAVEILSGVFEGKTNGTPKIGRAHV